MRTISVTQFLIVTGAVILIYLSGILNCICCCNLLLIVTPPLLWKNWNSLSVIVKTLPRDVRFTYRAVNSLVRVKLYERKNTSLVTLIDENIKRNPHKVCIFFENEKWTFKEVDDFSNQIANAFQAAGYRKGDVVALLMSNSATYICMWLGLAKIGAITALINTNLRQDSLLHSLRSGEAKAIIYASEYLSAIEEVASEIKGLEKYQYGGALLEDAVALDLLLQKCTKQPPKKLDQLGFRDRLFYIYTSGTTGLPKAAIITNVKCFMLALASWHVLGFRENDILYNTLPLYHTAGGVLGIMATLVKGFPVVIRKKFSASQYWTDCIHYNCTIGLYIGEMCRYVLNQPPKPTDSQHNVRMLMGNGMRTTVWKEFLDRFKIGQICELYGSTEGNTNLINIDKTVGAVGFLPQFVPRRFLPMDLIRVDETGQPIRSYDGLCIRCKPGEPGTFVGVISTSNSSQEFAGYVGGDKENKRKILTDVFKKGDQVFFSGDLLVTDELGYIYFKDRLGDTFRWKGENVSAAEVEGIVSRAVGNLDVSVYGVEIGNLEGRAGMATIVDPIGQLSLEQLARELDRCLPVYARPLFIRIAQEVDLTGTFKLKKTDLQRAGFDPDVIKDSLYFRQGPSFVPLTKDIYNKLQDGQIRV